MKIRNGFVSNSSSSSFVLRKDNLTLAQRDAIFNHHEKAGDDRWDIHDGEGYIEGWTIMDNFDMYSFIEELGVSKEDITWGQ